RPTTLPSDWPNTAAHHPSSALFASARACKHRAHAPDAFRQACVAALVSAVPDYKRTAR
ncbi:hypothetical protein GGH92_009851, partial [Coemansia sp. RSA 2673]